MLQRCLVDTVGELGFTNSVSPEPDQPSRQYSGASMIMPHWLFLSGTGEDRLVLDVITGSEVEFVIVPLGEMPHPELAIGPERYQGLAEITQYISGLPRHP